VSRLFTPRAIAGLEPKVRAVAAEVLDRARDRGEIDIVAEFSTHLPMMVIAEMLGLPMETREEYAKRHGLDPAKQWIALLPGSRKKEINANLGEMLQTASDLELKIPCEYLVPVASTIDPEWVTKKITLREWAGDKFSEGWLPKTVVVFDARAALFHSRAAVVASGTATVQAVAMGNPFVVVYRVSPLTYKIAKRLVRYPAEVPAEVDADGNLPIAMPNLIAGRRIVPELINDRFTAENVAAALKPLLEDGPERAKMIADLTETRAKLGGQGSDPIARVCDAAVELIQRRPTNYREVARKSAANV